MTTAALSPSPHLVVFGRDTAGKAHASWFDQPSAELATKAAGLMGMHAVAVESDALRELAVTLPKGRVFSSGRAFTPFVAGKLYAQLVELTKGVLGLNDGAQAAEAAAQPAAPQPEAAMANDNAAGERGTGSAAVEPEAEASPSTDAAAGESGTKPAVANLPAPLAPAAKVVTRPSRAEDIRIGSLVLATTGPMEGWWEADVIGLNGNMLTLRFRDFKEPSIVRRRTDLGFLPAMPV